MSTVIENIEKAQLRQGLPSFSPGDRVRVHFQVIEGNRRRTQVFEGVVLRRQGSGLRETFTVRKQSFGVGVERTFPLHSPKIEQLEVAARGDVRRAKLYYLRGRIGKAARVTERRWGSDDALVGVSTSAAQAAAAAEAEEAAAVAATAEEDATAEAETAPEAEVAPEAEAAPDADQAPEPETAGDADGGAEPEAAAEAQPEGEAEDQSAEAADEDEKTDESAA